MAFEDRIVVDTDVVSYLFKNDTRGKTYRDRLVGKIVIISFMTLAELERWCLVRKWGDARKDSLKRYLRPFATYFADAHLCRTWAEVNQTARQNGFTLDCADAWIAATAIAAGASLLTNNPRDYQGISTLTLHSAVT
jgi:tRNA(fMet)-specific endonuclease VapC